MQSLVAYTALIEWISLAGSLLLVLIYELRMRRRSKRNPMQIARTANARVRENWVRSLMGQPGHEVLAVQTLRNSVMSSTITASTAVLALMGTMTLLQAQLEEARRVSALDLVSHLSIGSVLVVLLISLLFAAFARSAMALRFYNHTGYIMGTQFDFRDKLPLTDLAVLYVVKAGKHYSSALRFFLMLIPVVAGLIHPLLLLPATVILGWALAWFDRAPPPVRD